MYKQEVRAITNLSGRKLGNILYGSETWTSDFYQPQTPVHLGSVVAQEDFE